ncbi:MAG: RNB domain-containing ribonuclease [Oligoflexia bacterium]|nr:RNB domain-containing ribonuclease [Oligoflexia bacterium]
MREAFAKNKSVTFQGDGLEDFKHIPFITIDNDDSKDLDQTVYVEKTAEGGYKVYYAIADASYFVETNSKLDQEAKKKGLTTYLPHHPYT